jgi:cell shape-determining protein MreC
MEELPRWKPTVTISDRQVREAEMEKRIVELVAELAKTIASHQRQNKVCEEYEEENEQLRVRITELEEASKA